MVFFCEKFRARIAWGHHPILTPLNEHTESIYNYFFVNEYRDYVYYYRERDSAIKTKKKGIQFLITRD